MRRGHAGIGGWRNENPRHFRPRGSGTPHFRPPRGYGLLDTPRFPPPGPRPPRGPPPYNNHSNLLDNRSIDHDRNKFRLDNRQTNQYRPQDRMHHSNQRSIYPFLERLRQQGDVTDHVNQYQDSYYEKSLRDPHVNSLGDVDHRQETSGHSGWPRPSQFSDDRHQYRKHQDNQEGNKIPVLDYAGHRPPASDHYGGNPSSSIDNSNSFSRSIDDTVDIVRRRLQNRSDPQYSGDQSIDTLKDEDLRIPSTSQIYQNSAEVQPVKKRTSKHKQRNDESNCDKIKSKIVHELFKMDKGRIHKLMDNPSSSTKFEYAISSLITESQNSLNKHMRSAAEKSLFSSEDFIRNDSNSIYEDTFMKQMQFILDPQDTVLLEDIKPLVMEELSKVLQLNEYDQPFQMVDEHDIPQQIQDHPAFDSYNQDQAYDYNDYETNYYEQVNSPVTFEDYSANNDQQTSVEFPAEPEVNPKPLFERRPRKRSTDYNHERSLSSEERSHSRLSVDIKPLREELPTFSNERRPSRRSLDNKYDEDSSKEREPQVPLFDSNTEQFSEEDDPFAELDKQYHVAVDHTFMETYDLSSPQQTPTHNTSKDSTNRNLSDKSQTSIKATNVKQEIDTQLIDMANSPLKLSSVVNNNSIEFQQKPAKISNTSIRTDSFTTPMKADMQHKTPPNRQESIKDTASENDQKERSENVEETSKSLTTSSSRKRSVDQRPSHRKEKRKKSETVQQDSNPQILNKDIIINVNDCATKDKEKCTDSAKSIFNLFFPKNENAKEASKRVDTVDKSYSDKYVKRKEPSKKKEGEEKKRQRSVSSSHPIVSPKDSANSSQSNKTESKTKLQTIDMFIEQPRKPSTVHQAHRNTALSPNTPIKSIEPTKTKQTPVTQTNRKVNVRTVATQATLRPGSRKQSKETQTFESKRSTSRFCQTDKRKTTVIGVQTDPVKFEKSGNMATEPLERMKEIDMEIQALLQEKFKLYSSLESNVSCPNTMQATLGMTVLNVPFNETPVSETNSENAISEEDTIVEDFTNIPVEELEQIAIESVEHRNKQSEKRNRRNRLVDDDRQSSASSTVKKTNRKAKTPNISLLEQILIDDRPIEDIISLDDLETTPVKSKKKATKSSKKKVSKKNKFTRQKINNLLLEYGIKDCYVLLERNDFSMYFKERQYSELTDDINNDQLPEIIEVPNDDDKCDTQKNSVAAEDSDVVEETVVENDIHFDMMDVSEDIIIGDICEVKSCDDKETERTEVVISEDIILDNSQSSEPMQPEIVQAENICKMYDYSTDENLRRDVVTVSGHADAVLAIESVEHNFVAACLDGNVYYFSSEGQLLSTLRGSNFAVTCLAIVKGKYETTVYTGSLDSRIRYYDLETGLEKGPECNVLSPIQTMDRAWDTIFVGTRTGFVLQFECKNNMLIPVSTVKFSDQSILALRAMKEGPRKVLLVAARSEDVTIKDAQTGLLLRTLEGPKMTVYTLLYEDGKVYCGTSSHQIHVFDYNSGSHAGVHEGGKGAVCLRATGGLVFAGCYDGAVYVFREGEPRPRAQLRGPSLMLLSLAVHGSKIIAGYKDRSLYIWKIPLNILQEMIL